MFNLVARSVIDLLRQAAETRPDQVGYTFLLNDGLEEVNLTYGDLDHEARAIAAYLQSAKMGGSRVLLLYPAGLEYIAAFFGCLYAGAVAVPAYPPKMNRSLGRLQSIAADAQATLVLTTRAILSRIEGLFPQLPDLQKLKWLATDSLANDPADSWRMPAVDGDTLAFLQYTSGSTAEPKGVMVSHGNILHNESMIQHLFEQSEDSVIVGWLPFYHDMGLIGNLLQPLYLGARCILMAPMTFLQQPFMWLDAITRYRATTSGGPDFAYNLCVRKITEIQKASLDLSSWTVAYNGAEPVRHETMENFTAAFAACGFRREAFQPCYGLAESTLLVSGGKRKSMPVIKAIEPSALERHRVVESEPGSDETRFVVSCGYGLPDQKMIVVDAEKMTECSPGEIGEIWLASPSVTRGYWNQPEETAQTFNANLADTNEGPFLRTGDLGFVDDGELFVTGRRKDLIIVRGLNYYPHDIELTVEQSHDSLRAGCGVAFSVNGEGNEKVVIVQEINLRREIDLNAVVEAIRLAVSGEHELNAAEIILTKPGGVPKTSSGKKRRSACREM
jgi:acyl-CoA synthetase (AMP-forming)/AMP-acid ligase II